MLSIFLDRTGFRSILRSIVNLPVLWADVLHNLAGLFWGFACFSGTLNVQTYARCTKNSVRCIPYGAWLYSGLYKKTLSPPYPLTPEKRKDKGNIPNNPPIEQPGIQAIYPARCTNSLNLPPATEIFPATPLISGQFLPSGRMTPRRRGHSSRSFECWVYSNQPVCGGARHGGNRPRPVGVTFSFRWAKAQ